MDQDFVEKEAAIDALAKKSVLALNLPIRMDLPALLPTLGKKIQSHARSLYERLQDDYEENLPYLFAFANKMHWFACWYGAHWFGEEIKQGKVHDTEYTRSFVTAEGYAAQHGGAWTLYESTALLTYPQSAKPLLAGMPFDEAPSGIDVMQALAYCMFVEACHKIDAGDVRTAMDSIHEAYEALSLVQGECIAETYDDNLPGGSASDEETAKAVRSALGKKAANAKLKKDPKQAEKMFVLECWNEWNEGKRHFETKAAFARAMMEKCEKLENVKVIEDWCRKWEKKHAVS